MPKNQVFEAAATSGNTAQVGHDLIAAQSLLAGIVDLTPIQTSRWLSGIVGTPVKLKCENLQRTGSFKLRGAYVRIARLDGVERRHGVVAASAGNHAQGVALSAALLETPATVFMPDSAAIPKQHATRAYGADLQFAGTNVEAAISAAALFAKQTNAVLIHPFDHSDVVAGQASVALEIFDQVPEASTIIAPVGGGGLVAGIALAAKVFRPDLRVIGVQAERLAAYPPSLKAGTPTAIAPTARTMADGIAVAQPGAVPFAIIRDQVDRVLTVSESDLSRAVLQLLERAKMMVEPAGAAAVAALLAYPEVFADDRCVVPVLSGGNIDPALLLQVIRHGMSSAGRYLSLRVRMPDRPGEMARLLDDLARCQVNLLDLVHERMALALEPDEVQVALQVETRGERDRDALKGRLRVLGHTLIDTE
ncbi:threonine ammonia-lyase [Rhodococcus qingshengii]|uniref:L-threonine dehydratase catabolic TdcB n=1 Tax=Rhodococcus qingshengii TaxID=334542 RepID=A0AAW6LUL0_RHOSG|nr:threonine ammonia-lyase [Rhodococcus qingshengii]MDE8649886.1 threonine ammonia-lyase [Rhodococcus qingshengii]